VIIVLFLLLLVSLAYLFSDEIIEAQSSLPEGVISTSETTFTGYKLAPVKDDISQLSVTDLNVIDAGSGLVELHFILHNAGFNNAFPSLKVTSYLSGARIGKVTPIKPSDYSHSDRFDSQNLMVTLPWSQGEIGYKIDPYYEVNK
jgi:hypothetical protein